MSVWKICLNLFVVEMHAVFVRTVLVLVRRQTSCTILPTVSSPVIMFGDNGVFSVY